jgi:uncharacterized protein (DUF58 family)
MDTVELLRKVKKIEIKAKGKSQDVFSGAYHTAFKGIGMSFAESRAYQYGDDVRNIDWNVTARTGETQIKIFEEERELTIMLLIDVSASQSFGSLTLKKDTIAEVAGILAINAMNNNDKVGAILFSDKIEIYIPPKKGRKNTLRIIREILNFDNYGKKTNISQGLNFMNAVQKKRTACFIFSDFIDNNYDNAIRILRKKHDLIPVKISDKFETLLPDLGLVQIRDQESGKTILIDTSDASIRSKMLRQASKYNDLFSATMKKYGIGSVSFNTDEDYLKSFIKFFKSR